MSKQKEVTLSTGLHMMTTGNQAPNPPNQEASPAIPHNPQPMQGLHKPSKELGSYQAPSYVPSGQPGQSSLQPSLPPQQGRRRWPCRMCNMDNHKTFECRRLNPQTPPEKLEDKGICKTCLGEVNNQVPHVCGFQYARGTRAMTKEQLCYETCGFSRKKLYPYENTDLINQSGPMPHGELAHRQAAASPPSHRGQGSNQPLPSPRPAQFVQPA